MLYLTNSFSVHMFGENMSVGDWVRPRFEMIDKREASYILKSENFRSYFGHGNTAPILSQLLGVTVNENRGLIILRPGDRLIIASLISKRSFDAGMDPGRWFHFWYVTFAWKGWEF